MITSLPLSQATHYWFFLSLLISHLFLGHLSQSANGASHLLSHVQKFLKVSIFSPLIILYLCTQSLLQKNKNALYIALVIKFVNIHFTSAITLGFIFAIVHSLCLCLASLYTLCSAFSYHIFPLSQRTIHPNCSFLVHKITQNFQSLFDSCFFFYFSSTFLTYTL